MGGGAQAYDLRPKLDGPVIAVPGQVVQGGDDRQGVLLYRAGKAYGPSLLAARDRQPQGLPLFG
jgi:hypothetical protein